MALKVCTCLSAKTLVGRYREHQYKHGKVLLFPLHQGQYQASTQTTWQVLLHGTSLDGTRVTYLTTVYFTFLHHLASHDHYYPKYHNISLMLYFLSVVFFFYCQYPLQFLAILSSLALECIGKYISLTKAWESTD